jgi:CheY-like chemotaxis protein
MSPARRILVVDDSEEMREFYQVALEQAGYAVETAAEGEAALAQVLRERPDLIVLDVVMPRMDGLELLLKLRSDLAPPVPPAILVSGFDLTEDEALRRGAARFLHKPIAAQDLVAAVADVLAGRSAALETIEGARERASTARRDARLTAITLMQHLEAKAPPGVPFSRHADQLVTFAARYLAVEAVVAAILREDRLRVLASSNPTWIAPELDLGEALPSLERVLESGSSLVLPDLPTHPAFARSDERLDDVRCVTAVPIRFDGRAVGVLCVFQTCSCPVEGEDLALVHLFSRRGTAVLEAWANGRSSSELPLRLGPGVAPRRAFERALDLELSLLRERLGSLELAVVSETELERAYAAVAGAAEPERLLAGTLDGGRIAFYKRDASTHARAKLNAVLAPILAQPSARIGIVDLAVGVSSSVHAENLLHLAEQALDDAIEGTNAVRRILVEVQDV